MGVPSVAPGPSLLAAVRGMNAGGTLRGAPAFLASLPPRYGPVASFRMPRGRFWFVDDPQLIETMFLASGYDVIKGRGLRRMRRLLGLGLLTSDEPLHLKQRRLVQPAFHRERIAGYARTMIEAAQRARDALRPGETVAVEALMNGLALRIAAATLFSADVDDDADAIGRGVTDAMAAFPASISAIGELFDYLPFHPATRRFRAARENLDRVIFGLIAQRRRSGVDHGDLLSMLLASKGDDGRPMPDELVRDESLTLLLAGHETTANAMTWTWDALARNPAAEARLHAELDEVLGDRDPTPDDVPRLRYAHDVIAESMRLRPPAWIVGRKVVRTFRLGPWTLPPGSVILTSPLVTHRNPAYWVEPDAFRPERWSNGEAASLPRYAYFPFGGGNRVCIGESFAWTEATLLLATLARTLRFRFTDATPVPLDPLVTLRPGRTVRMLVEGRTPLARAAPA